VQHIWRFLDVSYKNNLLTNRPLTWKHQFFFLIHLNETFERTVVPISSKRSPSSNRGCWKTLFLLGRKNIFFVYLGVCSTTSVFKCIQCFLCSVVVAAVIVVVKTTTQLPNLINNWSFVFLPVVAVVVDCTTTSILLTVDILYFSDLAVVVCWTREY